jgi:hypothetical protein
VTAAAAAAAILAAAAAAAPLSDWHMLLSSSMLCVHHAVSSVLTADVPNAVEETISRSVQLVLCRVLKTKLAHLSLMPRPTCYSALGRYPEHACVPQ